MSSQIPSTQCQRIRNVGTSEMEMASEPSQRSKKTIFGMIAPWPDLPLDVSMSSNSKLNTADHVTWSEFPIGPHPIQIANFPFLRELWLQPRQSQKDCTGACKGFLVDLACSCSCQKMNWRMVTIWHQPSYLQLLLRNGHCWQPPLLMTFIIMWFVSFPHFSWFIIYDDCYPFCQAIFVSWCDKFPNWDCWWRASSIQSFVVTAVQLQAQTVRRTRSTT